MASSCFVCLGSSDTCAFCRFEFEPESESELKSEFENIHMIDLDPDSNPIFYTPTIDLPITNPPFKYDPPNSDVDFLDDSAKYDTPIHDPASNDPFFVEGEDFDCESKDNVVMAVVVNNVPTQKDLSDLCLFIKFFPSHYTRMRECMDRDRDFKNLWIEVCDEIYGMIKRIVGCVNWDEQQINFVTDIFRQEQYDLLTIQQMYAEKYACSYEKMHEYFKIRTSNEIAHFINQFSICHVDELCKYTREQHKDRNVMQQICNDARNNASMHTNEIFRKLYIDGRLERLIDEHAIRAAFYVVVNEMNVLKNTIMNEFVISYLYHFYSPYFDAQHIDHPVTLTIECAQLRGRHHGSNNGLKYLRQISIHKRLLS